MQGWEETKSNAFDPIKKFEERRTPRFKKTEENDDFLDDLDEPDSKPFQRRPQRERSSFGNKSFERKERGGEFRDRNPSRSKPKKDDDLDDFE